MGPTIFVRRVVARPMQFRMSMPRRHHETKVPRGSDGLARSRVLPPPLSPLLSLSALRTVGLGVVGVVLLLAALVATPFFMALGSRHANTGRDGTPHVMPPRR